MAFLVETIGKRTLQAVNGMGKMMIFLYATIAPLFFPPYRGYRIVKQVHFIGVKSLFVIVLTAAFTGMVLGLQGYYTLRKFVITSYSIHYTKLYEEKPGGGYRVHAGTGGEQEERAGQGQHLFPPDLRSGLDAAPPVEAWLFEHKRHPRFLSLRENRGFRVHELPDDCHRSEAVDDTVFLPGGFANPIQPVDIKRKFPAKRRSSHP